MFARALSFQFYSSFGSIGSRCRSLKLLFNYNLLINWTTILSRFFFQLLVSFLYLIICFTKAQVKLRQFSKVRRQTGWSKP